MTTSTELRHLPGFTLPPTHPLGGLEAWQCSTCDGIFYPDDEPTSCPYCDEDADEESA